MAPGNYEKNILSLSMHTFVFLAPAVGAVFWFHVSLSPESPCSGTDNQRETFSYPDSPACLEMLYSYAECTGEIQHWQLDSSAPREKGQLGPKECDLQHRRSRGLKQRGDGSDTETYKQGRRLWLRGRVIVLQPKGRRFDPQSDPSACRSVLGQDAGP
ncbi:unnamed protein product [Pleuronectes platessa]|uniref:Uncharacterized protein n=1 Tax=Pleuronectes platessa TaxID=8262 RepID=A0A9N7VKN1_PLEPL|nr:unnamed protein product [Pleuronectes platessa]